MNGVKHTTLQHYIMYCNPKVRQTYKPDTYSY